MSALAKPNLFRRAGNRLVEYAKNLANDYRTVLVETAQEARARPLKTVGVGGLLAFLGYAAKTNPDQRELDATLCSLRQRMALLPVSIHSTKASSALQTYTDLLNTERLDLYDLWFFSLVLRREHDRRVFSPVAQDSNLTDWPWTQLRRNFVDLGAFGRFHLLEKAFVDYDIRTEEFE